MYGWKCPNCGAVYSPNTQECWRCNPKPEVTCAVHGAQTGRICTDKPRTSGPDKPNGQ